MRAGSQRGSATVSIRGRALRADRERVERWAQWAARELELGELRVRAVRPWRREQWGATRRGIWLPPSTEGMSPANLGYVICETAATHKLALEGIEDRDLRAFERALIVTSFSQRFAYCSVRRYHPSWRQPLPEERLLGILASGQTGYELGTAVGLAAAGDEGAGDRLEVWALERESEPQVRALVERVRSMILLPESPAVLASELAWLHAGLGAPA